MKLYEVIVTCDVTESACLQIKADSAEEAQEKAIDLYRAGEVEMERDEMCDTRPYITHCEKGEQ